MRRPYWWYVPMNPKCQGHGSFTLPPVLRSHGDALCILVGQEQLQGLSMWTPRPGPGTLAGPPGFKLPAALTTSSATSSTCITGSSIYQIATKKQAVIWKLSHIYFIIFKEKQYCKIEKKFIKQRGELWVNQHVDWGSDKSIVFWTKGGWFSVLT